MIPPTRSRRRARTTPALVVVLVALLSALLAGRSDDDPGDDRAGRHVDHDEGLFASYDEVTFHSPLLAGDVLEVSAELVNVGRRSRTVRFEAAVLARSCPEKGETTSRVLAQPILITTATGTVVTPTAYRDSRRA